MDSLFSIVKVVLILGVMYLIYKLTRPLTPEQLEDREKQKRIYQNVGVNKKAREKQALKDLQVDLDPEAIETMSRITQRIKSQLTESEIKSAISKEFQSIDSGFDKEELILRTSWQSPIIIVEVTRIDDDWLVSVKYDPDFNLRDSDEKSQWIMRIVLFIAVWIFYNITAAILSLIALLILGALVNLNSLNKYKNSASDLAKNIERCLQNLKNEFSSTV